IGCLPSNLFSISTSPACSSLERWLERFPLVRPVMLSRNRKSALSHAESAVRIARRDGSWTRRLRAAICSNGVGIYLAHFLARAGIGPRARTTQSSRQQTMIQGARDDQRHRSQHKRLTSPGPHRRVVIHLRERNAREQRR